MSRAPAFGTLTIRPGQSPREIRRDVLQAMRRHFSARAELAPADREAAAQAATRTVLARLAARSGAR